MKNDICINTAITVLRLHYFFIHGGIHINFIYTHAMSIIAVIKLRASLELKLAAGCPGKQTK